MELAERTISACKRLYSRAKSEVVRPSEADLIFLRNFLVLQAAHVLNPRTGTISIIPKTGPSAINLLKEALRHNEFDTGVPELNEHVKNLDRAEVCQLLLVNRKNEDDCEGESPKRGPIPLDE